jgi:hypothetical protein
MRLGRGWAAVALLAATAVSATARAQAATCDVPVIYASHGHEESGPQIDEGINRLKPYLEQAPFTAWHHFALLDRKALTIAETASSSFTLPNGRQATLTFLGHTPGTSGHNHHRMRLKLLVDDTSKKQKMLDTTFVLDEGGVVLLVGQKYQAGVLILGVSCKTSD